MLLSSVLGGTEDSGAAAEADGWGSWSHTGDGAAAAKISETLGKWGI